MRRALRIAEQHRIPHRPARIADIREIPPDRLVGHQLVPPQGVGEYPLAIGQRRRLVHARKPGPCPGRGIAFEHEGAHVGRMPVVVRVKGARLVLYEGLRERVEHPARAEPGELVAEQRDRRAEIRRLSDHGIGAIRRHHEIEGLKIFLFLQDKPILRRNPGILQSAAQQLQEPQPADRREADAVDHDRRAPMHDRDVGPGFHRRRDPVVGFRVVGAQELERLLGEHHAEAEGRIARVLLDHADLPAGQRTPDKVGEVQAGRPRAGDENFHSVNNSMTISRSQRLPGSRSKRSCQCAATSAGGIGTGGGSDLKLPRRW